MLLSEAIMKGSEGRKQCVNTLEDHLGRVCAIGAVQIALNGQTRTPSVIYGIRSSFPFCPMCGSNWYHMEDVLAHLNDKHQMTFQEIADFLIKNNLDKEIPNAVK